MGKIYFPVASTRSNEFVLVDKEGYQKILEDPSRNARIMQIRNESSKEQQDRWKRALPGTCDHALNFTDGIRHQQSAVQSHIYGCDYDFKDNPHMTDPAQYFNQHILPKKDELHLLQCYVSTRGKGLQTKCLLPSNASIAEAQKWQADLVGLKHDKTCTNLDRIFFLPHKNDILFMDWEGMFGEKELTPYTIAPLKIDTPSNEVQSVTETVDVKNLERFGINVMTLAERTVVHEAQHPLPLVEGERNNTLHRAILKFWGVESDPNVLLSIFSQFGLDKKEVQQIIRSVSKYRGEDTTLSTDMRRIIRESRAEAGLITGEGQLPCSPIPRKLPLGFHEWASIAPEGFAPAVIMSILPLAGTLATNIQFDYLDGNPHRTSFMTHVVGGFASGKSFIRNVADCFLVNIRERDAIGLELERDYQQKLRQAKNSSEQPEDPRPIILEVAANSSIAKLMKRMEQAQGCHLIKVIEEIDTSTKANKAGAWSEHSDIDRLAFDNVMYIKDSISADTWSGRVKVNCNVLSSGTYKATKGHYGGHVENGLVSRTIFATLPDNFGGLMPIFKKFSPKQQANLAQAITLLEEAEGQIQLPKTLKVINQWLEEKRQLANETQSLAIDSFRRRSAVIGCRAGALAYILCDKKETKVVTEFALWVADYVLQQQVSLWGSYLESQEEMKSTTPVLNLYQELPDEFTREELRELRLMNGMSDNERMNLSRWKKANMIIEIRKGLYVKTHNQA